MKKTHRAVGSAEIPVQYLADYMAASNQARRGIVQKSKYKSLARVFQHQLARKTISDHILEGNPLPGNLPDKAAEIRAMLADSDFDAQLYGYNADFVDAFAKISDRLDMSGFEVVATEGIEDPEYHGTRVRFAPPLLTYRLTRANTQKIGAIMYRYSKGNSVSREAAEFQAAFMFGYFSENPFYSEAKPEHKLCMVIDAYSGETFTAPTNAIYKFNEMKAVCSDIFERWEKVQPPNGAVI